MAGDEEMEAVAALERLVWLKFRPDHDTIEKHVKDEAWQTARDVLDRVRSRPAGSTTGGTEGIRDKDAKALDALADHPKPGKIGGTEGEDPNGKVAQAAESAQPGHKGEDHGPYDFPGPSDLPPVPDTEGEDHEAGTVCQIEPYSSRVCSRGTKRCVCDHPEDYVPSPAGGTELDTAKLVEALRWVVDSWDNPTPAARQDVRYQEAVRRARKALAGFSVDAGKAEEER